MNTTQSVIFDLDGVLLDSKSVAETSFLFAYAACGGKGDPPLDAFFARMGRPIEIIQGELGLPSDFAMIFREAAISNAHKVTTFPGVRGMLTELRDIGFALGIVTGKDRERTMALLAQCEITQYFEAVVTPDDAPPKPSPVPLWQCAIAIGGHPVAGFFGDSPVDMLAADSAGFRGYWVGWGDEKGAASFAGAIRRPKDVPDICLRTKIIGR